MKKENLQDEHCPYCKRHCSLSDPHCKKGRALAEEKLKSGEKLVEKKKKQYSKNEPIEKEDRLTHLFYACTLAAPNHKKKKEKGHKKKHSKKVKRDSYIFDSLNQEERNSLEHILEKLYEEWTSKREDD